jgi:threonine dehydratase
VGLEILEQLDRPDVVIGSVGGGGLMAGVGIVMRGLSPTTDVWIAQAQYPSTMVQALKSGKFKAMPVHTFADGVAISRASHPMVHLLKKVVDRAVSLPDDATAHALLVLLERGKMLVEGSGALPLAALEASRSRVKGKKVVLILSGGNIDLTLLSRMIETGLTKAGRRLRLNVKISDRTGSLHRLTGVIAEAGANIIQAIHDRSEPFTKMDETGVELTLETKGAEHSKKIIQDLQRHCLRVQVFDR